jgi:hypothetical protein
MNVNAEKISNQIFSIMKSYNMPVKMYTEEGKHTIDTDEARRFYNRDNNIMVNFDISSDYHTINVGLGKDADIDSLRNMLEKFKMLANKNVIDYNVKTFGKNISPKDFLPTVQKAIKRKQQNNISEGFTKPWGTVRTSRQRFENATLYIRHKKSVDENIRGSRSRNISSIFIENNKNERFRFPYNSVPAARAMTVHVSEGGTPYDDKGKHILSLTEETQKLGNFLKYTRKNSELSEGKNELISETRNRVFELKKTLGSLSTPTGYGRYFENINLEELEEIEQDENLLETDGVTELQEALPYLTKINETIKVNKGRQIKIAELAKHIANLGGVPIRELNEGSHTTPDDLCYCDSDNELVEWLQYYSQATTDQTLSNSLSELSEEIASYPKNIKETMNKVLTLMKSSVIVAEQDDEEQDTITESLQILKQTLIKFV